MDFNADFHSILFSDARVLVLGDVMLDRYLFGGTSRISPEAPVPVVQVDRIDERPGGAANVALGVRALGAFVHVLGITGRDENAEILQGLLTKEDVSHHLISLPNVSTITKLRVLSRNQQMIRLDTEKRFSDLTEVEALLWETYCTAIQNVNTVILSDYDKGTLTNISAFIQKARSHQIPILVDPKSRDFSIYRGATVLTPNLKEFETVAGVSSTEEGMVEKAYRLMEAHDIQAMVITRSERGISVIEANGPATHIPAIAKEVHDVTGAGDTVIAVIGAGLASGMDLVKAASIGNRAAGIAVGKLGAAAVTVHELQMAWGEEQNIPVGIMEEEALLNAVRISKAKGERIVFTNGCFDILHAGHVMYLEQAKRLGDRVIVAVNTDASVSKLKGPTRPINDVEERMQVLAALKSVDWVVSFSEDTPDRIIQQISPHILVKGGDYKNINEIPGAKYVLSQGGKVQLLGLKEGVSTTRMIEKTRSINEVLL